MRYETRLTPENRVAQISLPFSPVAVAVMNNTPYSVLIRRGSNEPPTSDSYDYFIPSGMYTTIAVVGNFFAAALDYNSNETPYYSQPATLIFYSNSEALPQFGASSYREVSERRGSGSKDYIIDTRAARGIHVELTQISPPTTLARATAKSVTIYSFSKDVTEKQFLYILGVPITAATARVLLAVTSPFLLLSVSSAGDYIIRWTLLDETPGWIPRKAHVVLTHTFNSPPVGVNNVPFNDMFTGILTGIRLAIKPPAGTEDYDISMSVSLFEDLGATSTTYHITNKPTSAIDFADFIGPLPDFFIYKSASTIYYYIPFNFPCRNHCVVNVKPNIPTDTIQTTTLVDVDY